MAGRLLLPLDFASDADMAIDFAIQKNGVTVDLTGYGASVAFALANGSGGFEVHVGAGVLTPGSAGLVSVRVAAAQMATLAGLYDFCELRLMPPDGEVQPWLVFTTRIATGASQIVGGTTPLPTGPTGLGAQSITVDWTPTGITVDSTPGVMGYAGWSPVFALVANGARNILEVTAWVGGQGPAPAAGVYVGPTGFVTDPTLAVSVGSAMAAQVSYDHTSSGLAATTVQGAIDYLAGAVATGTQAQRAALFAAMKADGLFNNFMGI